MPRDRAQTLAHEIVARLQNPDGSEDVFLDFADLDSLPADVVREALKPWIGPPPDADRLDDATRRAHGMAPRALHLRSVTVVEDADVLDLGPIAEQQLRLAGKTWDDADLEPEERLDGELEGTFAGTLRHEVLAETESGKPTFEVVRFHENCGVVFRAGSVERVAILADGIVETRDRRVRAALEEVLSVPRGTPPEPAPEPAPQLELELAPEPEPRTTKKKTSSTTTKKKAAAKKKTATSTTRKKKTKSA